MTRFFFVLLCLVTLHASASSYPQSSETQSLERIAFGSCAKERQEQPIWDKIMQKHPDMFLFIGDNQYADNQMINGKLHYTPVTDSARFEEAYRMLSNKPGFQTLRENVPIMATWDDHDYGANDAGKEYPLKKQSQQAFLNFFNFPKHSALRQQEGIYHARTFGQTGRRVQIIMLDTRYHRDSLVKLEQRPKGKGPFIANQNKHSSMLGEAQWQWLEQQLKQAADIRLIVTSVQLVANEHGWEAWGNMPHERQKMYDLINKTKANGVVFLSGDRHIMEISRDKGEAGNSVPYPMWDFTSSGLTQKPSKVTDPNQYRIGPVLRQTHYGMLEIEWDETGTGTKIHMLAYGEDNQLLTRQTVFLDDLKVQ